ncbi:hypothetical protein RSAG8_08778, partial [Rhizoctonia solani AG-8 WAC10335]
MIDSLEQHHITLHRTIERRSLLWLLRIGPPAGPHSSQHQGLDAQHADNRCHHAQTAQDPHSPPRPLMTKVRLGGRGGRARRACIRKPSRSLLDLSNEATCRSSFFVGWETRLGSRFWLWVVGREERLCVRLGTLRATNLARNSKGNLWLARICVCCRRGPVSFKFPR